MVSASGVETTPVYLAIDPGEKHNGWATFDASGNLITMGTVEGIGPFTDWIEKFPLGDPMHFDYPRLKRVIVEDYRIGIHRGGSAAKQKGSRALTIKTIGMIESWAYRNKIPLELQPNAIKPTGYMWAGIKVPSNKDLSHETDAYVHGVHWLQKNGVRRPQQSRRS
jgi:hypothetical protein